MLSRHNEELMRDLMVNEERCTSMVCIHTSNTLLLGYFIASLHICRFTFYLLGCNILFVVPVNPSRILLKILILSSELLHQNLVCLPGWLDLEKPIHGFKRQRLCLWDAEKHEEDRNDHKRSEEKVNSISPRFKHLLGESRNDEIPEPVVGRCIGLTKRPRVLVKHFGVDDPRCSVPRRRVERRPQVEKENGRDAARGQRGITAHFGGRIGNFDVRSDKPHAERAANGTNHQKIAPTHTINQEKEPNYC
jgi:hypothetical protein